jgi:hypothetical protein
MRDLYSNDKIRKRAELLVEQDVYYCVSSLIYGLNQIIHDLNQRQTQALGIDEDDLQSVSESKDYEEPAERHIDDMDRGALCDYLEDQDVEFKPDENVYDIDEDTVEHETTEHLRELAKTAMREQGAEEFCNEFSVDPDYSEVYEHWVVSGWLAHQLKEQGHCVGEVAGMTIWGRPTTGQSISMDGVILGIAAGLVKDDEPAPAPEVVDKDTKAIVQTIFDESRNGCNEYIRHPLTPKLIYTDGAKEIAEAAGAYWLLDIIGTEATPALLKHFDNGGSASAGFVIHVTGSSAVLHLTVGDDQMLWSRSIEFTSFPEGRWEFELAVDGMLDPGKLVTVLLLPTEH